MAALGRQVLGWQRLSRLSWASRTSRPREHWRPAALLRGLTTASGGGLPEEAPCVGSKNHVQEPECGTDPGQCLPEKQSTPVHSGSLEPGKVTRSLLDMGFSDAHVKDLLDLQPGADPQQLLDIISELVLLGLNPEPVHVALKKSPQLLKLPVVQMKKRSRYLRKLGLTEGKLRRLLHGCPEVFTVRQQDIDDLVKVFREKCLFTAEQVTEILHRCPGVLREDPRELEYKFQYAYFRMGVKHLDIVRTEFFQYSVNKVKQRHIYLERLGRYQTPDKKGQTQIANPLLKDILRVSEAEFLAKTACSSAEEFEVFKKLLAQEEEEEEEPEGSTSEEEDEDEPL